MLAAGLENDEAAIAKGVNLMRTWVLDGVRSVDGAAAQEAIDGLDLRCAEPAAVLLIQTIAREAEPLEADEVLDWVDHFEGDSPKTRRRAVNADAYEQMAQELGDAAAHLISSGVSRVVVRGPMRLASWFAAGEALSEVTGVVVTCGQRGQQWSSDRGDGTAEVATSVIAEPETGEALAVAVGFAADVGHDVVAFIESSGLPVRAVLQISHMSGRRLVDAQESVNTATAIKQAIRAALREHRCNEVHLFIAAPAALALHLGHQWNRVAPTTVWEDLGFDGYQAAFRVEA
jgi:NTP pyrophosphatase (non-canonical NTP hydrolase)